MGVIAIIFTGPAHTPEEGLHRLQTPEGRDLEDHLRILPIPLPKTTQQIIGKGTSI